MILAEATDSGDLFLIYSKLLSQI